jgi:hypothetical protein
MTSLSPLLYEVRSSAHSNATAIRRQKHFLRSMYIRRTGVPETRIFWYKTYVASTKRNPEFPDGQVDSTHTVLLVHFLLHSSTTGGLTETRSFWYRNYVESTKTNYCMYCSTRTVLTERTKIHSTHSRALQNEQERRNQAGQRWQG